MDATDSAVAGLVTLSSAHDVSGTIERLKSLLSQKGIQLFADIDHAAGARQVGLPLRPTRVLIFGNPAAGTPLMQAEQTIGLDLPLRMLVWEDADGKAWLTFRKPELLAELHQIRGRDDIFKALSAGLRALADGAAAP